MRGPTFGSSDWQVLKAVLTSGELRSLPVGAGPLPGSCGVGKFGAPLRRMHAANFAIAVSHSACCDGDMACGPPPGMYLRHACIACRNCGELGSTLPVKVRPPTWSEREE